MNQVLQNAIYKLGAFTLHTSYFFQNDDDFLAVMLVMGGLFFAIAAVVGIVLCLLFVALLISLLAAGLISTSVLVGLHQKSTQQGFKTFFIAGSIIASTLASVLVFWIGNVILKWTVTEMAIFFGLVWGVLSGWLLGYLLFMAYKRITLYLKVKYTSEKQSFSSKSSS